MQRKIIAVLLAVVMLFSICTMAGCRRGQTVDNTVNIASDIDLGDEIIQISFTHTMGAKLQDVLNTYIEEFNKIYPNIQITHQSAGGWGDINGQINTEIAGSNPPNVAYCYPDHVAMYNIAKSVVVLDDLIASEYKIKSTGEQIGLTPEQRADFIDSYYNEGLVYGDNKMYTMPLNKSTEVLYYDKTFFEANNLSVPTTWDELWAVCAQIKEIDPNIMVEQAAGITCGQEVYDFIMAGSEAAGAASGIMNAEDPIAMIDEMIAATRRAADDLKKLEG